MTSEQAILDALRLLLTVRVNQILDGMDDGGESDGRWPPITLDTGAALLPPPLCLAAMELTGGEAGEKDRIVRNENWHLSLVLDIHLPPAWRDVQEGSFRYAEAIAAALRERPDLGDRTARFFLVKRLYRFPSHPGTGGTCRVQLGIDIALEGL